MFCVARAETGYIKSWKLNPQSKSCGTHSIESDSRHHLHTASSFHTPECSLNREEPFPVFCLFLNVHPLVDVHLPETFWTWFPFFCFFSCNDLLVPVLLWSLALTHHNVSCLTRVSKTLTMSSFDTTKCLLDLPLTPTENNNGSPWFGGKHCVVWLGCKKICPCHKVCFFCCCFCLILAFSLSQPLCPPPSLPPSASFSSRALVLVGFSLIVLPPSCLWRSQAVLHCGVKACAKLAFL